MSADYLITTGDGRESYHRREDCARLSKSATRSATADLLSYHDLDPCPNCVVWTTPGRQNTTYHTSRDCPNLDLDAARERERPDGDHWSACQQPECEGESRRGTRPATDWTCPHCGETPDNSPGRHLRYCDGGGDDA